MSLLENRTICSEEYGIEGAQSVVVLGSTGSIGCSTLALISQFPERFEVLALVAGSNVELLNQQIQEFSPKYVGVARPEKASEVVLPKGSKLLVGSEAAVECARLEEADIVVAGIVGMSGLPSVLAALEADKKVALANKESLVAGGAFVREIIENGRGQIIPVDSEHSALFQALGRERDADVSKLILTASGGPFRETPLEHFSRITPEDAIAHPRWSMGRKISVDSATLMNKALEVIEAHWLFGVSEEMIDVVVHPESIIHSMVEYVDGTILAQLSVPDMKGAIGYALSGNCGRLPGAMSVINFPRLGQLRFEEVDEIRFPSIGLAREAIRLGETASLILNVVNEEAVDLFLDGSIRFDQIFRFCSQSLEGEVPPTPGSVNELYEVEKEIRRRWRGIMLSG